MKGRLARSASRRHGVIVSLACWAGVGLFVPNVGAAASTDVQVEAPRIRAAAPFPGQPRIGSAAAYDSKTNRMYIHGGVELSQTTGLRYVDELWAYDLDSDVWIAIPQSTLRPGPRVYHDLAIDSERRRLYLFGGKAPEFGCTSDLWSLSLETLEWKLVAPEDPLIDFGRQDPILNVHQPTGDVWVHFGGCDGLWVPNYYYRWSVGAGAWTRFSARLDEARERQAGIGVYDPLRHRVVITGGHAGPSGTLEGTRLWRSVLSFDPSSLSWEHLTDGTEDPPKRRWMVGGFDDLSDLFVTYGGYESWPPRSCQGCIALSTLAMFDMRSRTWLPLEEADSSFARVRAAGDYCRCTGELMVHAGSQSQTLLPAYRYRFQSQAFFVAIEHQADFEWLTPRRQLERNHRALGVFELADPAPAGHVLEPPVLIDCATRESLQVATDLHPLGGSRYRITFDALTARTLDAWARDRLILVGRIDGERRSFLARIRTETPPRADSHAGPAEVASDEQRLRVDRTTDGWHLSVTGLPKEAVIRLSVYDVRGRRLFSGDAEPGASDNGLHWNGLDANGQSLPQGVYFARAEAPGLKLRTKFLLLRP